MRDDEADIDPEVLKIRPFFGMGAGVWVQRKAPIKTGRE